MKSQDLNSLVKTYKAQLDKGDVSKAYLELIKFVTSLRTRFSKNLAKDFSFGSIFQGYMDYTYFYFKNDYLKTRKLKFALVLNHAEMTFEIWLLGQTKPIQKKYWKLMKATKWISTDSIPQYSVFEYTLVESADFNDLDALAAEIENELTSTASDILVSLSEFD